MLEEGARNFFNSICCSCAVEDHDMIDDGRPVQRPLKIGKSFLLYGKRRSFWPFHCLVGPDWVLVVCVYVMIISIHAVALGIVSMALGWIPVTIGLVGLVGLLVSYSITVFSDPGIIYRSDFEPAAAVDVEAASSVVAGTSTNRGNSSSGGSSMQMQPLSPKNERSSMEAALLADGNSNLQQQQQLPPTATAPSSAAAAGSGTITAVRGGGAMPVVPLASMECGQCGFRRPYDARHCIYCGNCIENLDHHCPWSGKCIGERNMLPFQTFVTFLCFQICYLMGMFVYFLIVVSLSDDSLPTGDKF